MSAVHIQVTTGSAESADGIVAALLDARLVACGQRIGPVTSRYWWRGSQEAAEEWLVILKSRRDLAEAVVSAVVDLHPYELPEVLVLPVESGNPAYLAWIEAETDPERRSTGSG